MEKVSLERLEEGHMEQRIIVGESTKYPLNGIITLPEGIDETAGKVPGVVFVHGSGASNMDEKVFALTPFKDLAEGLAARGIASIRYDKRTYVYGKKMTKELITAKEETIDDAIMATEFLRANPAVDPDRVFIVGHSMGAMLAPRIDAEGGNYRGLVMMAGTPYRIEEIMVRQFKQVGASKGILMKFVAKLEDRIFSKKFDGLYEMSDEEAKNIKFAGGTTLYYFKEMGMKTAADYLSETDKPTFIMQGEKDFQVLADVDYAKFKELFSDRPRTRFKLYENLNHAFVPCIYDDISKAAKEYKVERHIGNEVIDDIADFVKNN